MRIYIVAPYEAMELSISEIKEKYKNVKIDYGVGDIYEGLELARKAQKQGYDVIISRGGTAQLINKNLDIPLVDMKLSGNDILKSILLANNGLYTAIVAYSNITSGAKEVIELLNLNMKIYTITDKTDITQLLIQLKKEGIEQVLGDVVAVEKAKELLFDTILFQSSFDTIKIAVDYSIGFINQITKKDLLSNIISKFFDIEKEDYCILKEDKIFFSNYVNFSSLPVSYENLIGIKYKYKDNEINKTVYVDHSKSLKIYLSHIVYEEKNYYLFKFEKQNIDCIYPKGIHPYVPYKLYKLVCNSRSMKVGINELKGVINNEIIVICGQDKFTIDNYLFYLHSKNSELNSLEVNLEIYDISDVRELIKLPFNSFIFKNISNEDKIVELKNIANISKKRIIIIVSDSYLIKDNDLVSEMLITPNTENRKDDLIDIFNFYIHYFHDLKGTKPLKLKEDFLEDFDKIKNKKGKKS